MTQIGQFTRQAAGFSGRLHTLALNRNISIVPAEPSDAENAPDDRVHGGDEDGPEIGAGWTRSSEKAGEYLSIHFDDSSFAQPIHAKLFRDGDDAASWSLHWGRPRPRREKG
ncbi:hypothetical protein ASE66_19285 [Bosea sp. Root483D1]|uniref:DUF736 domain-containing protein n=1 Tax=Bosea sp. Root483D1 TaxID=1736544 RepID=UPI00070C3B77|nr:DUF736 domain-containing protein [Bosea sp. Root483D1]KRE12649.1 hypothetical protein ASE66_19285 [Bosea sp. Root483D1]